MSLRDANGLAPDDAKMALSCIATDDMGYPGTYPDSETAALSTEVVAECTGLRHVRAIS